MINLKDFKKKNHVDTKLFFSFLIVVLRSILSHPLAIIIIKVTKVRVKRKMNHNYAQK